MLWDRTFQIIKVFHEKYFYNPLMGVIFYTSEFFTLTTRYGSDNKLQTFSLYYLWCCCCEGWFILLHIVLSVLTKNFLIKSFNFPSFSFYFYINLRKEFSFAAFFSYQKVLARVDKRANKAVKYTEEKIEWFQPKLTLKIYPWEFSFY